MDTVSKKPWSKPALVDIDKAQEAIESNLGPGVDGGTSAPFQSS